MILLVTGTRLALLDRFPVVDTLEALHERYRIDYAILGDCKTGVDRCARETCTRLGIPRIVCEADWLTRGDRAGPERNTRMVETAAALAFQLSAHVLCAAFPRGRSPGTRDCMRKARAEGFKIEPVELS